MYGRKITSLTLGLAFLLLILSSLVLYAAPEGRVAYWSDWRWLGLSKPQWADLHINIGFLFLVAGVVHLYYNWRPLLGALRDRARQLRLFSPAGLAALGLNLLVLGGSLLGLPPFSTLLDLSDSFKKTAALHYGEPPYGHAERSPLSQFAQRTGLDLAAGMDGLRRAGLRCTGPDQTLLAIAQANQTTPKAIHDAMLTTTDQPPVASVSSGLPARPVAGIGRISLHTLCARYNLQEARLVAALAAKGIQAQPQQTLREIAEAHQLDPATLYERIHALVSQQ